ncbi:hypothetical protein ABC195_06065 [Microbacterium sp. 2P01SA-2]|uniref:hypothetical protein n=1 Tax=unclassified Microbacterium TaxID=2609290 RepID=UPI0039A33BA6
MPSHRHDDDEIRAKWLEYAAAVDRLAERIRDPNDFGVLPGSSLAEDDKRLHPFELSQAVRHLINAAVDQLHGVKTLVVVARTEHLAVGFTLARAAIENTATALWMLGPPRRDERFERVLRWHVRNYQDEDGTVGHLVGDAARDNIQTVLSVADSLGLEREQVARGYRITTPIDGAKPFTNMDVRFEWSVASGFAHGRPWAYQGLLKRTRLTVANGHDLEELMPRTELSLWLPLQALHLLGELLRMRELRAGYMPSAPPPP